VLYIPAFGHFDEGCFTGCLNLYPVRLAIRARRMPMARTQAALTTHLSPLVSFAFDGFVPLVMHACMGQQLTYTCSWQLKIDPKHFDQEINCRTFLRARLAN
jgi:hypothetical protein